VTFFWNSDPSRATPAADDGRRVELARGAGGARPAESGGTISRWSGSFADTGLEARFAKEDWPARVRQLQIAGLTGGPVFLSLGYSDYVAIGTGPALAIMISARIAICCASLGFAAALSRIKSPLVASFGVFVLSLSLAACFLFGVYVKHEGAEFRSSTIMALVLIYYFFVPIRLPWAAAAAVLATSGYLAVLGLIGAPPKEIAYVAPMLVLLNVLGYGFQHALGAARRRAWLSHLLELRRNLELQAATDEAMRDRADAQAANASKSRFLANMSHELRTPLNAIIGFSEAMRLQIFGPLGSAAYQEYVRYIHDAGRHLLDLVNDVLDLAKIEAGKFHIDRRPTRLGDLIQSIVPIVAVQAKSAGIELAIRPPSDRLEIVANDRALKQMLLNLLANALKFTPRGGTIALSVQQRPSGGINITVADTGSGIGAGEVDRLFEPFEQGPPDISGRHSGTGLGLPLVKALMSLHDGSVGVTSEPLRGTSVTLRFPDAATVKAGGGAASETPRVVDAAERRPVSLTSEATSEVPTA